jgi:hypothetical protein
LVTELGQHNSDTAGIQCIWISAATLPSIETCKSYSIRGDEEMRFRVCIVFAIVVLVLPSLANAVCSAFYPTVADGRVDNPTYFVPASATIAVYSPITAGHSYSLEMSEPYDNLLNLQAAGASTFFVNLLAGHDCASNSSDTGGAVVDTGSADPPVFGIVGRRVSFVAPATEYVYAVINNNDTGAAHNYRVTVTDTTYFNPRWSTNQGYISVYGFQNNSSQTIHGTLTVNVTFGGSGTQTYSLNGGAGLAPGAQLLVALGPGDTIDMPAGRGGSAVFVNDGPPGGLTVDAYFANSISLVPAVFAPRNSQH